MMIVFALSSAPCFELFSAAPAENNFKLQKRFQTLSFQKAIADGFLTLLLFTNRGSRIYIVIYSYVIMDKTFRKYAVCEQKVFIPPPDGTFAAPAISIPHFSTWGCTSSRVEVAILIFHLHSRMHPNFIGGSASTSVKRSLNLYLQIEIRIEFSVSETVLM